jgi:ABC-type Zn uptake system ZnuABC Zn-binding protein ZnuA
MRVTCRVLLVLVLAALGVSGAVAADRLRVVATIPDLKPLAEAVGGDLVEADTLAPDGKPRANGPPERDAGERGNDEV